MFDKNDWSAYGKAVGRHWALVVFSVTIGAMSNVQTMVQSIWPAFFVPIWVWLGIAFIGLSLAQFLAWRDLRKERDGLRAYNVGQETLTSLAQHRDFLISHQNRPVRTGTELGQWIEQHRERREQIGQLLRTSVSEAEYRAFDHIGLFDVYAVEPIATMTEVEFRQYVNWRGRVARDHKWIERFIFDYGRHRVRANLLAIAALDPVDAD
jgi:hypothetical protein